MLKRFSLLNLLTRWRRRRAYAKVPYPYQNWSQVAASADAGHFYPDFLQEAVARERAEIQTGKRKVS